MFVRLEYKSLAAAVASVFCALIGGWDALAQALVALVALDVVSGLIHAYNDRRLNSSVMRRGLVRKFSYFLAVMLAVMVDRAIFQSAPATRTLVIAFLCVNESLSVLEHLAAVGVPLPSRLKEALERAREEMNDEDDTSSKPQP